MRWTAVAALRCCLPMLMLALGSSAALSGQRILVDPPPEPSGGSRAPVREAGEPAWIELEEAVPQQYLPPLRRSDPEQPAAESLLPTPPPVVQWNAITQTAITGLRPPDDHIAAGPGSGAAGRVVEVTNQSVQIFDKTGASVAGPTPLATMFPAGASTLVFDPKVLFDQHSGRFFIVVLDMTWSGGICTSTLSANLIRIAVSTTSTPSNLTTDWTLLAGSGLLTVGGVPTWADYPGIGADSDALFITTNQFDTACTFRGSNIRVFDKSLLLAGVYSFVDLTYSVAATPGIFTIQPAHVYGTTDNGGFYLISRAGATTYRLFNITGDPAAPVASTGLFAWTAGSFPSDTTADQCSVLTPDLDTLSSRVQNAVYRSGSLWCTLTSDPDLDGQTEVVWQEITTNSYPSASPTVAQSGFIDGSGTMHPWTYMPSINVNAANHAAISFSQSSATQCPSFYGAIRFNSDPPGTFQAPALAIASAGFYDDFEAMPNAVDRWGDYSGCAVDPTDQCFWMSNEFAATSAINGSLWGTHIAKFCTATDGACCFGPKVCGTRTPADCATQGGTFQGLGSKCPTQNVRSAMHSSGPVVHWVDPAVNCFSITPLTETAGGSTCCEPHPGPGCDEPACQASVCDVAPDCCQVEWLPHCGDLARQLCPKLCGGPGGCHPDGIIDPWITPNEPGRQSCENFGDPAHGPIPANFFGPGSDPFVGVVCYEGEPLGPTPVGEYGLADTLVLRSADPFDRCDLPSPNPVDVPIQILELNLVSIEPIVVTFNGGQNPEPWDVRVNLSDFAPSPPGTMTIQKTHCNGGTWTSFLPVQPKLTFTRVDDPSQIRVLDTGQQGIPPIALETQGTPWVNDLDPNVHLPGAECTSFHPGLEDPAPITNCDCNASGQRDDCDVEQGLSPDCNANLRPDECDPDGDLDLVPDDCDNCPADPNPGQEDADLDRFGDLCDLCPLLVEHREGDHDGDKIGDFPGPDFPSGDNCPCTPNFDQSDANGDGIGDACEATVAGQLPTTLLVEKLGGGNLRLSWDASCLATDDDFAVYRGSIGGTFTSHAPVVCTTGGAGSHVVGAAIGDHYFLVVPTSGGLLEGSYGLATSGERPPAASACLPQALGACP